VAASRSGCGDRFSVAPSAVGKAGLRGARIPAPCAKASASCPCGHPYSAVTDAVVPGTTGATGSTASSVGATAWCARLCHLRDRVLRKGFLYASQGTKETDEGPGHMCILRWPRKGPVRDHVPPLFLLRLWRGGADLGAGAHGALPMLPRKGSLTRGCEELLCGLPRRGCGNAGGTVLELPQLSRKRHAPANCPVLQHLQGEGSHPREKGDVVP